MTFNASFLTSFILTSIALITAANAAETANAKSYQLMLIGGQLEVCSNVARQHCNEKQGTLTNSAAYLQEYELSKSTLKPVIQTTGYQALQPKIKSKLDKIFDYFYNNPQKVDSVDKLGSLIQSAPLDFNAGVFFNNLPKDVYYAIIDFTSRTNYSEMKVELEKSKSLATKEILSTFVKQAQGKRKPDEVLTLRFLTSSQRNPFETVTWYQQALTQAANLAINKDIASENDSHKKQINISWIPLDQSLMQALEIEKLGGEGCSALESLRNNNNLYNAQARYPEQNKLQQELCRSPEKLESYFSDAHGIFIADANFVEDKNALATMSLFRTRHGQDTVFKEIIQRRFNNHEIFMAGNGEGARILSGGIFANRPIPLLTGGTGTVSLIRGAFALPPVPVGCEIAQNCPHGLIEDDLTFESMGGLGLFSNGIVDTHFSDQNRHARLATLAAASKTRFSFGIDTNTALLVADKTALLVADNTAQSTTESATKLRVIGDQGVYIIDMRDGIVKTQSGKHQIIGLSHNLNQGDVLSIDNTTMELTFSFSDKSKPLSKKGLVIPMNDGVYHRNVSFNCGTTTFHRWNENNIAWLINPGEDTQFLINPNQWGETCSYSNLLFGVEN